MKRLSDTFFSEEERLKIKDAIRSVESMTTGEVVVLVADSSDHYAEAEVMGGIFLGSFISLVSAVYFFEASLWAYVPLSFALFFPSRFLYRRMPVLKASLIGSRRKSDSVRQRAITAFYEKGLYKTKEKTGVLFFISLLERKVWVLADSGISEKIDQETLNTFAKTVSQGIKEGRACDALCNAIKAAGGVLSSHFPKTTGDIDELQDDIMTE